LNERGEPGALAVAQRILAARNLGLVTSEAKSCLLGMRNRHGLWNAEALYKYGNAPISKWFAFKSETLTSSFAVAATV
jgi:hypothetical protein